MKNLFFLAAAIVVLVACGKDDEGPKPFNGFDIMPDPIFKEYCKQFDTDNDDILSETECRMVREIDLSNPVEYEGEKIASLAGVELFTELEILFCENNVLTSLDVSKNTKLQLLTCWNNDISALDLSKNVRLRLLYCTSNNLAELDVAKLPGLMRLDCGDNNLSALDVSKNYSLEELYCEGNDLSSLDVANNSLLKVLLCYFNNLSSLDVSKNTSLEVLSCFGNNIAGLDITKNTKLETLLCGQQANESGNLLELIVNNNQLATWNETWMLSPRNGGVLVGYTKGS